MSGEFSRQNFALLDVRGVANIQTTPSDPFIQFLPTCQFFGLVAFLTLLHYTIMSQTWSHGLFGCFSDIGLCKKVLIKLSGVLFKNIIT